MKLNIITHTDPGIVNVTSNDIINLIDMSQVNKGCNYTISPNFTVAGRSFLQVIFFPSR